MKRLREMKRMRGEGGDLGEGGGSGGRGEDFEYLFYWVSEVIYTSSVHQNPLNSLTNRVRRPRGVCGIVQLGTAKANKLMEVWQLYRS